MSLDDNNEAEKLLISLGYLCESDPEWIQSGKKPDFFCSGPCDMWVEVKSFQSPDSWIRQGDLHKDLHNRLEILAKDTKLAGYLRYWFRPGIDTGDNKSIVNLIKWAHHNTKIDLSSDVKTIFMLPNEPILQEFILFTLKTEEGEKINIISYRSETNKYGMPIDINVNYFQDIQFQRPNGLSEKVPYMQIATMNDDFRIALTFKNGEDEINISLSSSTGVAQEITTKRHIREIIKKANNQFKNGCKFKKAPCLLILYDETIFKPEQMDLIISCYGDLNYTFSLDENNAGDLFIGKNGAFNQNKHKTTSALTYIQEKQQPLTIHNIHCNIPLPTKVLGGLECKPTPGEDLVFV